jgi:hypothetical protein
MWGSSGSVTLLDPSWVYDVWVQPVYFDPLFVQKQLMLRQRSASRRTRLQDLYKISKKKFSKDTPELWDLLDRAMDAQHWTGSGDSLTAEDGEGMFQVGLEESPETEMAMEVIRRSFSLRNMMSTKKTLMDRSLMKDCLMQSIKEASK